jgi:beta-glucosidase
VPEYAAGVRSIMISYTSWGGLKMHAHEYLITDVLRGELGFDGFIVADWGGVDQISADYYTVVVTSINVGLDMNMVPFGYQRFIETALAAVENGDISEARIDEAVSNILTVKFDLGLLERPYPDPSLLPLLGSDEHRALAREAVAKSLVLLKNEGDILPPEKDLRQC